MRATHAIFIGLSFYISGCTSFSRVLEMNYRVSENQEAIQIIDQRPMEEKSLDFKERG
jgi:hypothetical protein